MPPHTSEDMHRHHKAFQFFFVLCGHPTIRFKDRQFELAASQGVEVPIGMWHQMSNDTEFVVEFLVISSPKSHGDKEIYLESKTEL